MDICAVEGCDNLKSPDDLLFCFLDRKRWVEYCKVQGIHEKQISENATQEFLNNFIEGGRIE